MMTLAGLIAGLVPVTSAIAARPAAEIVEEYDATPLPKPSPGVRENADKMRAFRAEIGRVSRRRGELAMELFEADPDHERVPKMMLDRWVEPMMNRTTALATAQEIERALPHFKNPAQVKTARHMRAVAVVRGNPNRPEISEAEIERFLHDYPKDTAGASLLAGFASEMEDSARRVKILKRLIVEFPESPAAKGAKGSLELLEKVGKPFDLAFDDIITGKPISIAGLKGKVVVLDFWATWCGPCVAEIPRMKRLYSEFRDRGVEFIGVSLDLPKDEGGLTKLTDYVSKNAIPWPQYYTGQAWESPLIERLGITSIPAVFLIDAEGKLAEIKAGGQLETLLPRYLSKARAGTAN
jgi:thiol-disulfide isomerase/thioredoxin